LPFALIGTLNTIQTFTENYGVKILNADSAETKIVWKVYHSTISLILVETNCPFDEKVYYEKLDLIFNALVILHGLDDLISINNVEKFKKDIRVSYIIFKFCLIFFLLIIV
jgi:hypothetical protein